MKRQLTSLLAVLMFLLSAAFPVGVAAAEDSTPARRVIRLTYLKLESGTPAQYERHVREYWKPRQQARLERGEIAGWRVYRAFMPQGSSNEYDYIVMTEFKSFGQFAAQLDEPAAPAESPEEPPAAKTVRLRTDTLAVEAATANWAVGARQVLSVSFIAVLPGRMEEHMKFEREWWRPWHEDLVAAGIDSSWAASRVRFPERHDRPYDSVSFDGFSSLTEFEKPRPTSWTEKWGGSKAADTATKLDAVRTVVRRELWRVVEEISAPAAAKRSP